MCILMIIKCPNCQTQYEVAAQAIGSAGRKVQCANCQQSWQARPEPEQKRPKPKLVPDAGLEAARTADKKTATPAERDSDRLFDADDEAEMDIAFEDAAGEMEQFVERVAKIKAQEDANAELDEKDEGEVPNGAPQSKRMRALAARQKKFFGSAPMARARRYFRMSIWVALVTLLIGSVYWRTEIVKQFPDLGGFYDSIGLTVNVVGLNFSDVETLRSLHDGQDVMLITAKIRNTSNRAVTIPAVLVNILDKNDILIFQWQARAQTELLEAGETALFETQLNAAPVDATRVQLNFSTETLSR